MEEKEKEKSIKKCFTAILTVQAICIALILIGVTVIKYASPETLGKISSFYGKEMCEKTDINDIKKFFK